MVIQNACSSVYIVLELSPELLGEEGSEVNVDVDSDKAKSRDATKSRPFFVAVKREYFLLSHRNSLEKVSKGKHSRTI